ncbi:proline iminopeptidase [Chitinophaga sp. YR573]|uniref:alpha/beta fold hydrolase n=1 Tax=Chitinophaga sp. YR573 TaxID=1881040 RepID=UPI0008C4DA9C|nr:alpha/beta hydrolase [Chitinophaga sp. YR573]SEW01058.1 proline iminopeptidase [Chitinophaga sp. YR573]
MIRRSPFLLLFLSCCTFLNSYCQQKTFFTSDSVALYLRISGKGTPCIYIHGGPGAWSKTFEAMGGSELEKNLTMYYYDQRGCGRSQDAHNGDYSMDRMIEDIENIRSITGSDKVYLMAHSFGGILAFKYAQKYKDHVKGLIMLDVTLSLKNSLITQIHYISTLIGKNLPVNDTAFMSSFMAARKEIAAQKLDYKMLSENKSTVEKLDSIDKTNPGDFGFAKVAFSIPAYSADYTKETASLQVPVLVISGLKDHAVGPDHYKLFHFPKQQTVLIDGGHVLYYEKNDKFVHAVSAFVK